MRATIKDVAREAGVSVSTVSYALSRKGEPIKDSHKRVLAAVDKLGYVPDATARSLVNSRTNNIGLIIPCELGAEFQNPYYVEVISIFSEELAKRGMWLSIYMHGETNDRAFEDLLIDAKLDGIVWANYLPSERESTIIERRALPRVAMGTFGFGETVLPTIRIDSEIGVTEALRHIANLGHTEIMYIGGSDNDFRQNVLMNSLNSVGLHCTQTISAHFDENTAFLEMSKYIESGAELPTAIFAGSDLMALGAIRALHEHGYNVPNDVSVIGHDDILAARRAEPPLSTVRQKLGVAVECAVDYLIKCRDEREMFNDFCAVVDTEFISRSSTAKKRM